MGNTRAQPSATPHATNSPCQGSPALRADAARNRRRVVDAACSVFGQQGLDAPLEEVASAAGVGIATLYRRFPTRDDLVEAVFEEKFSSYTEVVEEAVGNPDPWAGLTDLINGLCELQASNSALSELVAMRLPKSKRMDQLRTRAAAQLEELLVRARGAGRLRPDAELTDLLLVFIGNAEIVRRTGDRLPNAWRRYAALQLEALRAHRGTQDLPQAPKLPQLVKVLKRSR